MAIVLKPGNNPLYDQGYRILRGFMNAEFLNEFRDAVEALWEAEGENAGSEFRMEPGARRLANLCDKGDVFRRLVAMPEILSCIGKIITAPFKLSSLNARSTNPQSSDAQPLHCDTGAVPDENGFWVANTVWLLDDFTAENGATRIVPGSHHWRKLPQDMLADPQAAHPAEILVTGKAGDEKNFRASAGARSVGSVAARTPLVVPSSGSAQNSSEIAANESTSVPSRSSALRVRHFTGIIFGILGTGSTPAGMPRSATGAVVRLP